MASKPAPQKAPTHTKPVAGKPAAGIPAPEPRKRGRPTSYNEAMAAAICEHIADGKPLRAIAAIVGMPSVQTIMQWLDGRHPSFREQYARAREAQADKLAEEILEIADDGRNDTYIDADGNAKTDAEVIARSKLRVDARKWLASKMAPKKYGDKLGLGAADGLESLEIGTRELSDAERAVRLTRAINDNPGLMAALMAAAKKKVVA